MSDLPKTVGLCSEHAPHFYVPDPAEGDICPECDLALVIYAKPDELREALKQAVQLIEEYEDPLTTPDVVRAVLDHTKGVLAGGEEDDRG